MTTPYDVREDLHRLVVGQLLGPADGSEEFCFERTVRDRYLVGMLAPQGQSALPEAVDEAPLAGVDGEDGITEAPPPKAATSTLPSSIGMTFVVSGEAPALRITARWRHYQRVSWDDVPEAQQPEKRPPWSPWQREPVAAHSPPIPLKPGRMRDWKPLPARPGIVVQGRVRPWNGDWIVTLFLVNKQPKREGARARNLDEAWLFQPELSVSAPDAPTGNLPSDASGETLPAIFCKRVPLYGNTSPEEQTLAMLYRHRVEFAVGHGVAVKAQLAPGFTNRAMRLTTAIIPSYDVPQTTAPTVEDIPTLARVTLDMHALAEVPDGHFAQHLDALTDAYAAWIAGLKQRIADPLPDLQPHLPAARSAVAHCETTLARIRAGIALLDSDSLAAAAFRFANRAMYLQRRQSQIATAVRRGEQPDRAALEQPAQHSWRVFQLAFVLLNLPALTDLTHPERVGGVHNVPPIADLLWFPTGGGKTEAYLGVAAYAMALRRLQGEIAGRSGHAGVAVLMRYTLRLLTLQQFQRATALICACEVIRRENPAQWGSEPFRIGLWVGRRSTPNWTRDAAEAVKQLRKGAPTREGTPYQLTNCPWCGTPVEQGRDLMVEPVERGRGRTFIYCGDPLGQCPFSRKQAPDEGIPALVVDEEIYRRLSTLLIATVDKFAQMPWNGRVAMLFGQVDGYCERHGFRSPELDDSDSHPASRLYKLPKARTLPHAPLRPPDLIIQDELHLISGPLGTLVGLYETAVDRLATWEVEGVQVRPKVIASTATVRQADTQVHNLFLRQVNIFPPQGLEAEDNFFARQREPSPEHPGRRYLGICAPGIRHKTALIQTYVAFLAAAQALYEQVAETADPWMTLVGYFSSLRELGMLRRAVDDTVATRLRQMDRRGLATRFLNPWNVQELTSRQNAADIPHLLDRLETTFTKKRMKGRWPIDVLLATNMISVGVDVGRLGLMVVANQPKNTAEYIQATSRVGRRYPGLVCTVYNWARPRDLSHYESFAHYHATFYQHVEALSVTPFSPRALDRGLTGVLTSLVRLQDLRFNPNQGAERIAQDADYIAAIEEAVIRRAEAVAGNATADLVRRSLEARCDQWLARVPAQGAHLGYREGRDGVTAGLLQRPGIVGWDLFTCLNSLRDVEPTVNLLLDNDGMGRGETRNWTFEVPEEDV